MKSLSLLALVSLVCTGCVVTRAPVRQDASFSTRVVSLNLGQRSVDEFDDADTDDQGAFGLDFFYMRPEGHAGVEAGITAAGDTEEDITIGGTTFDEVHHSTSEIYAGLRFVAAPSAFVEPYLSLGIAFVAVSESTEDNAGNDEEDEDITMGAYARGGVMVDFDPVVVGIEGRILRLTDTDLKNSVPGMNVKDVDYEQIAFFVGWSF